VPKIGHFVVLIYDTYAWALARTENSRFRGPCLTDKNGPSEIERLYKKPLTSERKGPLYNAFSYPTKIDAESIAVFIATHTNPGETILDPFGGSGTTGIAAKLCANPTEKMKSIANDLGIKPSWGPRNAVIIEISTVGAFVAEVMTNPPDPGEFADAAKQLIQESSQDLSWMYTAKGPDGKLGKIRHIIWSEILITPCCKSTISYWDACVKFEPLEIKEIFNCPKCHIQIESKKCHRKTIKDSSVTGDESSVSRKRLPVFVYGESDGKNWARKPTVHDTEIIKKIEKESYLSGAPSNKLNLGDLYRGGYHTGIERISDLYTSRNFRVISDLWTRIEKFDSALRPALKLLILSYNASHSTILSRVVVKRGMQDFVTTGAQSGVLYVSGLPLEKNIYKGLIRKITTLTDAFSMVVNSPGKVSVLNASSTSIDLEDRTIDYVFTDPPFGDFIPYSEVNQINEIWLGELTNQTNEAIVSVSQGKGTDEYAELMLRIFAEVHRVMKPKAKATVVFHASKVSVWSALSDALEKNNLQIEATSILDKTQVSFKQVVHDGGTRGDAMFLLKKKTKKLSAVIRTKPISVSEILADATPSEIDDDKRLYSRFVTSRLENGHKVDISSTEFYKELQEMKRAL
jgi:DNA modification methylase